MTETQQQLTSKPTKTGTAPGLQSFLDRVTGPILLVLLATSGFSLFRKTSLEQVPDFLGWCALGAILATAFTYARKRLGRKSSALMVVTTLAAAAMGTSPAQARIQPEVEWDGNFSRWEAGFAEDLDEQLGLGFGDELPPGALADWAGFPCWQLRMEEDAEGFLAALYGVGVKELLGGLSGGLKGLALLEAIGLPLAVATGVLVSWEVMLASGCGACGEDEPFDDWEVGRCGPPFIDCCLPPEKSDREVDDRDRRQKRSEHEPEGIPDRETVHFLDHEPGSGGWQGARDLAGCPLNGSNGNWDQDDENNEECINLDGESCTDFCPPANPGSCVMNCDTCGACVYGPC